jgi:hypothetical protein
MKRLAKVVRWFVLNGVFAAAGVAGIFYHINPAMNVFLFIAWATSILSGIMLVCVLAGEHVIGQGVVGNTSEVQGLAKMFSDLQRSVPAWFGMSFDFGILGLIVMNGHYILGFFYLFHMFCESMIFTTAKNVRGEF